MVERFLRDMQLAAHESIELDEIQGLVQLASNGLGVALIPMVEALLHSKRLSPTNAATELPLNP